MRQINQQHSLQQVALIFVISVVFVFVLVGCSTAEATLPAVPTLVEFPTETQAPLVVATDAVTEEASSALVTQEVEADSAPTEEATSSFVTQEVEASGFVTEEVALETQEALATENVFVPAENVRYQNEEGDLFVVVTSVSTVEQMPNLPEAPEGQQFVVLSTTLANLTGTPDVVEASSITLIDQQFNRYSPVENEDFLRTSLAGAELNGASTMLGAVRFSIPEDAIPYLLEWCPFNDCDAETLQTRLP